MLVQALSLMIGESFIKLSVQLLRNLQKHNSYVSMLRMGQ